MDYERIWDGAFIEASFENLRAHLTWLFAFLGADDPLAQRFLLVALIGVLIWVYARWVSPLGYRVNLPVGVAVQTFTLGPVLTFLLLAIPAWLTFRSEAITKAFVSFFRS